MIIRKVCINLNCQAWELTKTDYYKFILKHYTIKMLFCTGLFKSTWNIKKHSIILK